MSTLSTNYTNSPLGLLNIENLGYTQSFNSLFSSWEDGDNKQKINVNDNTNRVGTNNLGETPHTNDIYDISNTNIIKKLEGIKHLKLESGDFAYLKDLGVYPNNRLVIVRRYPNPVSDDLYSLSDEKGPGKPLSTIIGWTESFSDLKITVSETWTDAEVSFKEILNEVGKDFSMGFMKDGLGNYLERGVNMVPLPGASLLLQRKIMKALGIIGDEDAATIPAGSPNLIKESKVRKTLGDDGNGSGLKGTFTITLKTTYEQKFINGQDPTPVFMDILNNALNMGTSPSVFYLGLDKDAPGNIKQWMTEFSKNPWNKIKDFLKSMLEGFKEQLEKLKVAIGGSSGSSSGGFVQAFVDVFVGSKKSEDKKGNESKGKKNAFSLFTSAITGLKDYVVEFLKNKYKVRFMGVITSLTGAPSTPWHITVGNPLKPIFCSGDMLCKGVDIEFGDQLSFNDLPSYITVTVKLESARNLGLQEIFAKFNNGQIRTTNGEYLSGKPKSFWNFNMDDYGPGMTNSVATNGSGGDSQNLTPEQIDGRIYEQKYQDEIDAKKKADELFELMDGLSGDNKATKVEEIFLSIETEEELISVIKQYGVKEGEDLGQWVKGEVLVNETKINNHLKSIGARLGIDNFTNYLF